MTRLGTELTLRRLNRRLIRRNVALSQRRQIIGDLRANIDDATRHVGERAALEQLGDLDQLAADYAPLGQPHRPIMRTGIIAAIGTFAALVTLSLVRIPTFGTIEVFDRRTGETRWHVQLWRLGELSGDATQNTLFEATVYSYGYCLVVAVAFAIGARLWRLRPPRSHRRTAMTTPRPSA